MVPDAQRIRVFLGRHGMPIRVRIVATERPDAAAASESVWCFETIDGLPIGSLIVKPRIRLLDPDREELEHMLDLLLAIPVAWHPAAPAPTQS